MTIPNPDHVRWTAAKLPAPSIKARALAMANNRFCAHRSQSRLDAEKLAINSCHLAGDGIELGQQK